MTTINQAKDTILKAFATSWDSALCPYVGDNEDLTNPKAPWARIVVRHTAGGQETLGQEGNRKYNRIARVLIQIFTAKGKGTKQADGLAQSAINIFEGKTINGLYFYNGIAREVGSDGEWYQIVVDITFNYDEIK